MWDRILFEEACTTVIDAVQHMPQLKTLHLEPIAEDSLCPEALFTLGKNIQELCILGEQLFSTHSISRAVGDQVLSLKMSMCALIAYSHLFGVNEVREHSHRRGTNACRKGRPPAVHVNYCPGPCLILSHCV
jgi:hypothetical protein